MKRILFVFSLLIILQSCSKDEVSASGSRAVKYEITGNFTGSFIAAGSTNNGIAEVFEVSKLPWSTEFTAKETLNQLFMTATGTGGVAGQTAILKIFVGGKEKSSSKGTALSSGIISFNTDQVRL